MKTCYMKFKYQGPQNFIGPQPCSITHISSVATLVLPWQNQVASTETV